jgi:hypothetical protein
MRSLANTIRTMDAAGTSLIKKSAHLESLNRRLFGPENERAVRDHLHDARLELQRALSAIDEYERSHERADEMEPA